MPSIEELQRMLAQSEQNRQNQLAFNPFAGTAKQYVGLLGALFPKQSSYNPPSYIAQRGSGFAVASTDWDDDFDANPGSLYESDYPTAGGMIRLHGYTTNDPIRAMLAFDSDRDGSVTGRLLLSAGNVQIKMNGAITDYAASATVTLSIREGRNLLRVAYDGTAGHCTFDVRIFDGTGFRWVDLRNGFGV